MNRRTVSMAGKKKASAKIVKNPKPKKSMMC